MEAFFTILAAAVTIFVLIVVGTQIVSCVQDKQKSDDIATSNTAIDCTVKFETQEYNETETLVYATIFIKNIGKTTVTTFDVQAVFVDGNGKVTSPTRQYPGTALACLAPLSTTQKHRNSKKYG